MPHPAVKPMRREPTAHVYYTMTRGLCGTCRQPVDAKVWIRDGAAYFSKFCPTHGHEEVEVASSASWYLDSLGFIAPSTPPRRPRPVARGCPRDCGPCELHQQATRLAIVEASDAAPEILSRLRADDPSLAAVELRGPTIEPALVAAARAAGFTEVRARAGEPLAAHGDVTTITVTTPAGVVERLEVTVDAQTSARDLATHLDALARRPTWTALELIPCSAPGARLTIPTLQRMLAEVSPLAPDDFVPSPFAHPHCLSVALATVTADGALAPLARTLGRDGLFQMLARGPALSPDVKTITLHALMDAADFDVARVMRCPIAHASALGTIPVCAHRALPGADR